MSGRERRPVQDFAPSSADRRAEQFHLVEISLVEFSLPSRVCHDRASSAESCRILPHGHRALRHQLVKNDRDHCQLLFIVSDLATARVVRATRCSELPSDLDDQRSFRGKPNIGEERDPIGSSRESNFASHSERRPRRIAVRVIMISASFSTFRSALSRFACFRLPPRMRCPSSALQAPSPRERGEGTNYAFQTPFFFSSSISRAARSRRRWSRSSFSTAASSARSE